MTNESPEVSEASLPMEVQRIRALLQGRDISAALIASQALRRSAPENRDVLYLFAVALRYSNRIAEALAALNELERLYPAYGRLFQERGHCYLATRSAPEATSAFLKAVALNPALPASWKSLEALHRMAGRTAESEAARRFGADLAELPTEILTAHSMFADGEIHAAEQLVRQYLLQHGDHIEGMRLLAQIAMKHDVADDAEVLLEHVLLRVPDYHAARYEYALALLQRHKHARAKEEMEKLLAIDPDNRVYRTTHATVCTGFGDFERALPIYQELLNYTPQDAELHLSIGHALKTLGRADEAINSYRAAAAARAAYGDAYWSLANLKTYRFLDEEIARMRRDEQAPDTTLVDRYHLCFALGKALEDRKEYAEAFVFYERGNALKKRESRYRPEFFETNARLQKSVCTREFFAARAGFGASDPAPIFIVGLPRSGSTLIEQILASHSQVEGTMELADIPRMVNDLQGGARDDAKPRYPGVLAEMTAADFKQLGERYLADTRAYRQGKPFFIDKMPNNFRHLGLIHLILPNAKIIDARREAVACCFSNYKQLFASGQQFTYSFEDIARYYRMYESLMEHWNAVLPGKVLCVQHEDLVANPELHIRRILSFCGLDFEPACVAFHRTNRRVHTASSEQVRRPISREGLDQWRYFEPWLTPLFEALALHQIPAQRPIP
jgi:tetratricopeptide (TPR) repeat protein